MKTFRIEYDVTEAIWVTNRYTADVEAETEQEAQDIVLRGSTVATGDWVGHRWDEPMGDTETEIEIESTTEVTV